MGPSTIGPAGSYARAVYDMVAAKQFGWSSGSVDHLVKIGENGEILVWPLIEGSITPTRLNLQRQL